MQIRSITAGFEVGWPLDPEPVRRVGRFLAEARQRFEAAGVPVQTVRGATQSFPDVLSWRDADQAPALARALEAECRAAGIDYCAVGPVSAGRGDAATGFYAALPALLCETENVFATIEIGNVQTGVDFRAVAAAAEVIESVSRQTALGFGNLRFAAIANCPAGVPFFPAAYHPGGEPRFAIAVEMADLAVVALGAGDPATAEARLTTAVEEAARRIEDVALALERDLGVRYSGIDLSPAPFPSRERSIGEAVERLGLEGFGTPGTLFAAALVTRALRKVQVRRCGFSGLMMPILEDATLALRVAEGTLTVPEALLYSAVCGTGLDTVPLPGDVGRGLLEGILLDVAALALALDKPLTARLMPVPGKKAGERTEFDFPYFANSKIMRLPGGGAAELMRRALAKDKGGS